MSDDVEAPPPPRTRKKLTIGKKSPPEAAPKAESPERAGEASSPKHTMSADGKSNRLLQRSFGIAVFAGVATAVTGMLPALQWIGFAGPLIAILAFFVFGRVRGFAQQSDTRQQFADSCYFLGFLLTMIAMLVGFFPAGLLGHDITSQDILRHFSMALGATALGLVCRILALQGGRSLGQIAAEVEATLTQYARNVSAEAQAIGGELAQLRASLVTQREAASSIVTANLTQTVEAAFNPIAEAAVRISAALEAQAAQIATSALTVQQAMAASSEQLVAAAEFKSDADATAQASLASVEAAVRTFETTLGSLQGRLSQIVNASADGIKEMTAVLERTTAVAPSLGPALESVQTGVASVSSTLDQVKERSQALGQKFENALSDDGRLLAGLEEAQTRVVRNLDQAGTQAREGIEREGGATRDALEKARRDFEQSLVAERQRASDEMREQAQRFSSDVTAATDRLSAILNGFAESIERAKK